MSFDGKKVFVFDWDGTLFDSMETKRDNFVSSLSQAYGRGVEDENKVREMYIELSGKPRHELFFDLSEQLNLNPTENVFSIFNNRFNNLNTLNLISAKLFSDAESFIRAINENKKQIFISSSVPEDELLVITNAILNGTYINMFDAIMGTTNSHQKGVTHIRDICEIACCEKMEIQYFGDDFEDYRLSQQAGVDCVIIDREKRHSKLDIPKINSFNDIEEEIHGKI
jgi:phosphoglycolate phosphatase-like HAD superfamily hydrolase